VAQLILVRSMRMPLFVAVAAAGFVCSCATYDPSSGISYEYDIKHPSQKDITRTRGLLHDVAARAGIPRHYGGDYSPWPIAVYMGDDVFLHAVVEHGQLRILLQRSHSPPSASFTRTTDLLEHAVAKTFGSRAIAQPPFVTHTVYAD
jgi:hypothetical protein